MTVFLGEFGRKITFVIVLQGEFFLKVAFVIAFSVEIIRNMKTSVIILPLEIA